MPRKKALIVLADGFEEIEAISPIDILRRAGVDVTVAGLSALEITGAHGVKLVADTGLDGLSPVRNEISNGVSGDFDAVVFPGGSPGAENLSKSEEVKAIVKNMHKKGKVVAAICASPAVLLAPTGILDGKKATCYPGMEDAFPPGVIFSDEAVVVDGNVVTARGPGTAGLFGIKLAEILAGKDIAESIKNKMLLD